jgi:hypothetical protein
VTVRSWFADFRGVLIRELFWIIFSFSKARNGISGLLDKRIVLTVFGKHVSLDVS